MKQIFCFAPHLDVLRGFFDQLGAQVRLMPVGSHTADYLRGIKEGEVFAIVANHPRQVPPQIMELLHVYGFQTMAISDQFLRARKGVRLHAS